MKTVLVAIASSTVVSGLVTFGLDLWRARRDIRWQIRREACLNALRLADAVFSHTEFRDKNGTVYPNTPQDPAPIRDIRECHNRLILACRRPGALAAFERCIGIRGQFTADAVADLRREVRRECGLGRALPEDRAKTWIAKVSQSAESLEGDR